MLCPVTAAAHGLVPAGQQPCALGLRHSGGKGHVAVPQAADLVPVLPHAGGKAGQIGSAQGRGLPDGRAQDEIPGKKLEALGVVRGSTVQSRNFGHDLMAGFRTLVGGEVTDYADMLTEARQIATGRMVKDAESLGADAIVGMRYASASVMQGAAEVIAYGTAVKFV